MTDADGCSHYHHCLSCPFSVCVLDDRSQVRREASLIIAREIRAAHQRGATTKALAIRYGWAERSIFRAIARARNEEALCISSPA